jgi:AraC family transcriptional regulator
LRGSDNVLDARVNAPAAGLNSERIAGFPNGRLFLDSIEQALAIALVHGYAVRDRAVRTYRGGLGPARLRRVNEFIHAKIEDELTLSDMAQCVGLSAAHFSEMFRRSSGETPHQFVLRCETERAKEILRKGIARIGCRSDMRIQNSIAFCAGLSSTVRSQSNRISQRISRMAGPKPCLIVLNMPARHLQ